MRAGALRQRINLESPNDQQATSGEVVPEFVTFAADVPASIERLSSREFFAASQVQSEISCKIRIRWMPGIHERMRIRHLLTEFSPPEVEYFDIEGPPLTDDTGRREIVMYVRRRSTKGYRQ